MKILIINWQDIKNKYSGGAEVHLFEIFKRIAAKGHEIDLLCCKLPELQKQENIDGINVIRIGNRLFFNWFVPFYIKKLLIKKNYDIVIDDINKIPFYSPIFVNRPILCILHHFFDKTIFKQVNFVFALYVYISERLMDFVYKKYPFVVVSKSTYDELVNRGYNQNYIFIVHNALDQSKYPMQVGNKYDGPTITYFGRLKKYKSIDHLLYAFRLVKDKVPNSRLYIVGKGDYYEKLVKICKKLDIIENVKFWGFVDESTKIEILSSSHCVVNTSIKEGWGITNLEANACGTPVISANVPGLKDSVKDGLSGLLYEYGNIEELANKIYELLTNHELRYKLEKGAILWAKNFSWDDSADKMLKIIENIASNYQMHEK